METSAEKSEKYEFFPSLDPILLDRDF